MHVSIPYKAVNYDTERVFIEKNKELYKNGDFCVVQYLEYLLCRKYISRNAGNFRVDSVGLHPEIPPV